MDGASAFCGVRLDEWTGLGCSGEEGRSFYTSPCGISIKTDSVKGSKCGFLFGYSFAGRTIG